MIAAKFDGDKKPGAATPKPKIRPIAGRTFTKGRRTAPSECDHLDLADRTRSEGVNPRSPREYASAAIASSVGDLT
jgi:hypothetical protein